MLKGHQKRYAELEFRRTQLRRENKRLAKERAELQQEKIKLARDKRWLERRVQTLRDEKQQLEANARSLLERVTKMKEEGKKRAQDELVESEARVAALRTIRQQVDKLGQVCTRQGEGVAVETIERLIEKLQKGRSGGAPPDAQYDGVWKLQLGAGLGLIVALFTIGSTVVRRMRGSS